MVPIDTRLLPDLCPPGAQAGALPGSTPSRAAARSILWFSWGLLSAPKAMTLGLDGRGAPHWLTPRAPCTHFAEGKTSSEQEGEVKGTVPTAYPQAQPTPACTRSYLSHRRCCLRVTEEQGLCPTLPPRLFPRAAAHQPWMSPRAQMRLPGIPHPRRGVFKTGICPLEPFLSPL